MDIRCLSSLTKVFHDEDLKDSPYRTGMALLNEIYSFQVAYRTPSAGPLQVRAVTDLAAEITIRSVGLAPSALPCYEDSDDFLLRRTPGLYPDPLYPVDSSAGIEAVPNEWRSIWITVAPTEHAKPGVYPIRIELLSGDGETGTETFTLEVIPARLPEQQLIHTNWFYVDCLATWYKTDAFSEENWAMLERYIQNAAEHGMNMMLTPIFTPPLETKVDMERPTNQLVNVKKDGDRYEFGFDKLERWIDLCQEKGIRYFEISHLFTQWGAEHAPKIMADVDGVQTRIFGWETEATGELYSSFIDQFLPELTGFLRRKGVAERSYFHISDEPRMPHLESYRKAGDLIRQHLKGFTLMDALSDYDFYELGLVAKPIPSTDHLSTFIENKIEGLWAYYCIGQYKDYLSNRFFNMPSQRNRVIGLQLYKFDIEGFLHWGYNHWYSAGSQEHLDPFQVTDAGYMYLSGDAFLVYPGKDGPIDSIRSEVFREALQDLRALQLLESRIGKEAVVKLLEEGLERPITFRDYPHEMEWLLGLRELVNRKIKEGA